MDKDWRQGKGDCLLRIVEATMRKSNIRKKFNVLIHTKSEVKDYNVNSVKSCDKISL